MEAKDIVAKEIARQAEFGMEPSWEDFVIEGIREGIRLASKVGLDHFIANFMTGEHHPNCKACKLLKEWGVREACCPPPPTVYVPPGDVLPQSWDGSDSVTGIVEFEDTDVLIDDEGQEEG